MKNNRLRKNDYLDEEDNDTNRWLLPYADFITLLLAVFVMMYSVSNVEESKLKSLAESLNIALNLKNSEPKINVIPTEKKLPSNDDLNTSDATLTAINSALKNDLGRMLALNKVTIVKTKSGISIVINDSLLFKSGQAQIDINFENDLIQIAQILKKYPNPIQIEGHTDNNRMFSSQYPSNWELSSARASSVVRAFITHGVPENQLTAIGFAANQPIEPNTSEEGRYRNRRVTIKILELAQEPR